MSEPLSPAAQAVLDAAGKQTDLDFVYAPQIAAATLRAAGGILRDFYANDQYPDHPDEILFDLAAELEGFN